ncbi:3,4-dihydroxy-2-butanone-4-phosphate synthase [Georgenia thermotolerans]|uniref:GTP cyclohydrolase-2 n=1 Tax=Georgenia thermotolerans TaxID=527326 RepID=A0A7J5UL03_9MICO|nr:3,4-dihydroxy-2-butanone-4-phosphate synthase [Georgenia thermotolerans]KAE8762961.1 3,4-dihydroxy-2-butanone-4-phosphate synthase [Georgenia thermotolerans]
MTPATATVPDALGKPGTDRRDPLPTGRAAREARVAAALDALRRGRPVLVADDAGRENEVDVVLAARTASAEWLAWTVRHSSGYLCAPMPAARADALDLPPMVSRSEDPRRTAYAVAVDAARGVTTGISAADRATTLRALADPASGPADLIRPGHVLPLRAVPGGVLERPGHTEAAVDLVRLAGEGEVGAIAELVADDGEMLRLPGAARLAAREGLVLLSVADLVAHRREREHAAAPAASAPARVQHTGTASLPTAAGTFAVHGYRDLRTGAEHLALLAAPAAGAPTRPGPAGAPVPLVRVHSECLTGDALGSLRCDCGPQLRAALDRVAREGGGAVVYLGGHEGRGIGLLHKIGAYALQDAGLDTVAANLALGWPADRREYGAAAAILADLGLGEVRLLTNNPDKVTALAAAGVRVAEVVGLEVGLGPHNHDYLMTKKTAMGHHLPTLDEGGTGEKEER